LKRGRARLRLGSAAGSHLERHERDEEARKGQRSVRLFEGLDRDATLGVHRFHKIRVVALLGAHH